MNANRTATREEVAKALELWNNILIKSEEYILYQQRSEDRHIERIRMLKGAMSDYTRFNPAGAKSKGFQHQRFGPIQREYNIPMHYRSPEYFLKEVETNPGALFKWRVCSVWDFYDLLCKDTPGYRRKPKYGDQKSGTISADMPKATTIRDNGKTPVSNRLQVAS
jgi:hypothetical protein